MLCLVSNAVKFSLDKSDIVVRIRRVSTSAAAASSSSSFVTSTTGELRKSMKRRAEAAGEQQQQQQQQQRRQFVQFSVQDSGPGLTEEEKIRYARTHARTQ
jgi:signal transduction histidine kinase